MCRFTWPRGVFLCVRLYASVSVCLSVCRATCRCVSLLPVYQSACTYASLPVTNMSVPWSVYFYCRFFFTYVCMSVCVPPLPLAWVNRIGNCKNYVSESNWERQYISLKPYQQSNDIGSTPNLPNVLFCLISAIAKAIYISMLMSSLLRCHPEL